MDSFEGWFKDPLSLHKYLYAHVNPVMGMDPSGMLNMMEVYQAPSLSNFLAVPSTNIGPTRGLAYRMRSRRWLIVNFKEILSTMDRWPQWKGWNAGQINNWTFHPPCWAQADFMLEKLSGRQPLDIYWTFIERGYNTSPPHHWLEARNDGDPSKEVWVLDPWTGELYLKDIGPYGSPWHESRRYNKHTGMPLTGADI